MWSTMSNPGFNTDKNVTATACLPARQVVNLPVIFFGRLSKPKKGNNEKPVDSQKVNQICHDDCQVLEIRRGRAVISQFGNLQHGRIEQRCRQ